MPNPSTQRTGIPCNCFECYFSGVTHFAC